MLLIGLITLLIAIPLNSTTITPTLLTRITAIILLFSAALSLNSLVASLTGEVQVTNAAGNIDIMMDSIQNNATIGSGLGLYSGLFHVTTVTQFMEVFLFTVGAFILLPWASEKAEVMNNNNELSQVPNHRLGRSENLGIAGYASQTAVPSIGEYPMIVIFTTIGASFLISSADLVSMYLSIELQSFAVYILAAIYRNSESATSAGLKYFLLGALSSALILLGSSLIYAYTGLTNFESIYMLASVTGDASFSSVTSGIVLGVLIIGIGFLFKVAAAPFHNWAPDVYDGVPTIVTTWLTVMPKISIFIFLLELQIGNSVQDSLLPASVLGNESGIPFDVSALYLGVADNVWKNLLLATAFLSLVIGTVVGLAQYRLKRLLAFSTISHVGFMLLALSVNSEESITSFLFYLMQYSITNLNAFFVVLAFGYIIHLPFYNGKPGHSPVSSTTDITFISQLKGQFTDNPILGLSLAICLFSMAGIPPLIGFFAKYMVLYSAIENGYYFLSFVGILASVISAAYYLRVIKVIHFDSAKEELGGMNMNNGAAVTSTHSYVIAVLTLFVALYLLSPSLLLNCSNLLALSLFTA